MEIKQKLRSLSVFAASLLWAADAPLRKPLLVGGFMPAFVSFLEHVVNSLLSLPGLLARFKQLKSLSVKQWAGLVYIGAGASALGAVLFVQGAVAMNYNFTVAALLQKLQPVFAVVLAMIFLKERPHGNFWILAPVALLGAYGVTFGWVSPLALWSGMSSGFLSGPALAIAAAALWAGGTVAGRSLVLGLDLQLVNGMRFVFGLLFLAMLLTFSSGFQFSLMTGFYWQNVIIISILTGFAALLIYYFGLKYTPAYLATLMELGYPLAVTLVNWKFLGIALSLSQIAGGVVLLVAILGLNLGQFKSSAS